MTELSGPDPAVYSPPAIDDLGTLVELSQTAMTGALHYGKRRRLTPPCPPSFLELPVQPGVLCQQTLALSARSPR